MIKQYIILSFLTLLVSIDVFAQNDEKKTSKVELLGALEMGTNDKIAKNAKRILGNVKLKQDDVFMYCDSVYLYTELNNFRAYGHVHLTKGDSIQVYSDSLYHFGNQKLSMFRGNVVMLDKNVKLYTDSLNYDMLRNTAYYYGWGKIVDSAATLTSSSGHYFTNSEVFFFKDSVIVTNENYTMHTDTLEYHSKSNKAIFKGPTTVLNDSNRLYAERGWYNTQRDLGRIHQNASYRNDNQTLDCDTLFYNRNEKYGEAFGNVVIKSLKDSINLTSNYAYYNEAKESSLATDSATMIQISKSDTTYLHADTLLSYVDTADGGIRNVFAYYKAQMFSEKIQMRCDSIAFSFKDSTVRLFGHPIIWSDSSQMKAENISFRIVDNELTDIYMKEKAIIISEKDSIHYNQIKGFEITGHLKDHELKKAVVNRRSETIYYLEEDGQLNSMNKTRCRQMIVHFKNGQANQIIWISEPEGQVLPLKDLDQGNMYFNDFEWLKHLRPKKVEDIYKWQPYTPKR
ncbi:MAG: hypothetical protein C0599_15635 [Salinivirgaceae bacterium]|nr:MAG: hypothetical protein C0599_15635 [Salinivirgaceae bacterium]